MIGLIFSILWASASVATKVGVLSAPPLILANSRFFIAGSILLGLTYAFSRDKEYRIPNRQEFKQLTLFGFLNTTMYLGLYVFAMKYTAAGIGSLAVSTNPLLIVVFSALWLRRKPSATEILCVFLGMAGIGVACYPLLQDSHTTLGGLILLIASMITVSIASVYYASVKWKLPNLLINGWQVFIAGILLLPFTIVMSDFTTVRLDSNFWLSVLWLSIAVSIVGLICWFHLLRIDTVEASLWLFLCPVFGFFYAWWLMDEPITAYTIAGTVLVILSLYLGQRSSRKKGPAK
nr:DMT family transporter [Pedobacter sp. SYSU D00873]